MPFSPVDNEMPLRWWRRLRLVPPHSLGVGRRAMLLALVSWLPIVVWALLNDRAYGGEGEPLLIHYGIHVRCLIVIPLLVLAELPLHFVGKAIAREFVASGAVTPALRADFHRVGAQMIRLRNASLPWALALGVAVAWSIADPPSAHGDELSWARMAAGGLGFGGAWFAYVSRPILVALLVGWLWRLLLVTNWMWRLGRLHLALVPAHPDRAGGIGFVSSLPAAFSLVTLALSAMFSSGWAHQVLHHGATLASYQLAAIAYAVGWTLLLLMPLLAFSPTLWMARWRALPQYASLAGAQGRLVQRTWIDEDPVADSALLEPAGMGVMADMAPVYEAIAHMRWLPARRETVVAILLPMAVPFLLLVLLSMPLREILATLMSVLK
jgi:hypothetical protein